ncbi:ESX-3 secretion system ATPase EccB3 [Mycolicibacterium cyprinidarum]|uniref:ESX-3 secretion system ATPase EccB3 n=1 Tax=Mycolicibacterium cyprinidarum TaxID=2860311 RepID=A0ABQ4VAM1_9MYCO|nr:ESX-3 secretion system ATPase EccB3 [Mycolicibacterium sp. NGTWSNA01]GJF19545.1 ESX-3 secretion system ATPase EccB3 [Mycolicibacterium sp. NGTWS0302]
MTAPDGGRRSFSSRTPNNENPDGISYRRGFVTRHQVTGWRFLTRRIAAGVALHDTRMLVDPLRTQSRAVLVGALVLVTGLVGCFLFSFIRPSGAVGTDSVLADRESAALYLRLGDQLHPVLNLTSARLITGAPDNPTMVKSSELDQLARGNMLGIPGAPERMVANTTRDAYWTVCDATHGASATTGVTVIAGEPAVGGARAAALAPGHAVLAENDGRTWLLWDGRRSPIDLADRAVTDGLGIGDARTPPQPIANGLFNALPEAPPLTSPVIPGAGGPTGVQLPVPVPVGAVVAAYEADNTLRHYVVLADGLQPISGVLASILRNTNSYGLHQPPRLGADDVARIPVARAIDTFAYPSDPITLVDTLADPITCAAWSRPEGAQVDSMTLLSGAALPIQAGQRTVELVSAGTPGGPAARVAMPPGTGYFVDSGGALFWVSDTGVRYGIDTGAGTGGDPSGTNTVAALGLTSAPLPMPWSVLSQFAAGPTLSRADALLAHDALAPDSAPARLEIRSLEKP